MYIGNNGHAKLATYRRKYLQGFDIADAAERVKTASVSLPVAPFESERYAKGLAYRFYMATYLKSHLPALDDARAGKEKKARF